MAHLFKPSIVRYVDSAGKQVRKGTPGAKRVKTKTKKWYGTWKAAGGTSRTEALATNKEAAKLLLNAKVLKAEMTTAGAVDPFEDHATRPLTEHVADFTQHLQEKGTVESHWQPVSHRVSAIIAGCGFRHYTEISASRVQTFLADLKQSGKSQQTVNHYLRAVKQFARWMVTDRRAGANVLTHLQGGNVKLDLRRERRELSTEEIRRLLAVTKAGEVRSHLTGESRFMLYCVAMGTGLRASELASLTPRSFDLDADPPTVEIGAANEKARRGDTLPLHPGLVAMLKPWLAGIAQDAPLWPGKWASQKRAGKLVQLDLSAARDAWIEEGETEAEKESREKSEFLRYRDEDGRQADFHALRHTFLSRLGRSGASPKAMQRLARHSTVELTLNRYTHAGLFDLASAVDGMPDIPTDPKSSSEVVRATGTCGKTADGPGSVAVPVAVAGDIGRHRLITRDNAEARSAVRLLEGPSTQNPAKMRGIDSVGACAGVSDSSETQAERQGFEPWVPCGTLVFETSDERSQRVGETGNCDSDAHSVAAGVAVESGKCPVDPTPDQDLARIIDAWPTLSAKARISLLKTLSRVLSST